MRLAAVLIMLSVLILLAGCGGEINQTAQRFPDPYTTPSGLTIQDFKYGDGVALDRGDVVTIDYTNYLENGTEVDSDSDYTMVAGVGKEILGWEQGISSMQVGGQRKLTIPPELAYGSQGLSPNIPPDATLISYIQVRDVAPKQTTQLGTRYVDLEQGYGSLPVTGDRLLINYTGWLQSDGTKFDNSAEGGWEFVFNQGNVIKGFDDGVATMQVGGKRLLIIPPELGYGDQGNQSIPGGATLIFEIDLLDIIP